jgi:hypothetical protein
MISFCPWTSSPLPNLCTDHLAWFKVSSRNLPGRTEENNRNEVNQSYNEIRILTRLMSTRHLTTTLDVKNVKRGLLCKFILYYIDQDRDRWRALVNAVMNLRVPQSGGNFLTSWETVSFSRRTLLHRVILYYYIILYYIILYSDLFGGSRKSIFINHRNSNWKSTNTTDMEMNFFGSMWRHYIPLASTNVPKRRSVLADVAANMTRAGAQFCPLWFPADLPHCKVCLQILCSIPHAVGRNVIGLVLISQLLRHVWLLIHGILQPDHFDWLG